MMNLRILTSPGFQTLLRELTWQEADQNFIDLLTLIQNAGGEDFPDVEPYDPLKPYTPENRYVTFGGNLWQNLSATNHTGVTPGTNALVWRNTSVGEMAHAQNTDLRLGFLEYVVTTTNPSPIISVPVTGAPYNNFNVFRLDVAKEFIFTTAFGQTIASQQFITYVPAGAAYSCAFKTGAEQDTRGIELVLSAADFAVWQRIGNKTRLLYTNVNLVSAETNSINEVSSDIFPDIIAIAEDVAITAESNQVNIGGSHTANEHVGKYIVATATTITSLTLHKVTANNTVGLITLDTPIIETATYDLQLIEPTAIVITGTDNIIKVYADANIVIRVPAITEYDNQNKICILREWGGDETKRVWIELQNNLNASALYTLLSDGDLIEFSAHTTGTYHFDLLNRIIN